MFLVGAWLVAAPFLLGYDRAGAEWSATVNDIVVGSCVALVALVRMVVPFGNAALGSISIALGLWLITAPFVLFYSAGAAATGPTWNDMVSGAVVVMLAIASTALGRRGYRENTAALG